METTAKAAENHAAIVLQNLTFTYPEREQLVLRDVSLTVNTGEFVVLCGPSGCGKTTLLRQLKPTLALHGRLSGEILFEGKPLRKLSQRDAASKIGFVLQSPENQIVTDKVWHELAFACEVLAAAVALSWGRGNPEWTVQVAPSNRKLSKRSIAAAAMILLAIPLTIYVGIYFFGDRKYYFISLLIILESMLPFALIFESRKPQARELVNIAVLCAIGVAGRVAFFMLPQFKPVVAVVIIAGVAFGGEAGFLVGAVTGFVSNMFFGQGPLTPWQMFAFGIIGFLAGILFRKGLLLRSRTALCIYGGLTTFLIYGGIMNPASMLTSQPNLTWEMLWPYYLQGIPFDLVHALATVVFLYIAAEPMLEKLDRIKVKYGLVE